MAERYGLFTIIVLGESILGATTAIKEGLDEGEHAGSLTSLAARGLVLVFPCGGCTSTSRDTSASKR
ncbi:low temperature requirement protein A [Amycolatopsis coloradensis]|uniref:low temperature requirement protein A n=1 Tax=Amycolatopsis coloradensis TaxID=76021 RepID=UPI003CC69B14